MHPQTLSSQATHFEVFKEGMTFIFRHKLLLQICLFMCIVAIFILGPYQAVVPEFLKQTFSLGEKQRGSFMAMFGVGLLLGGIASTFLRTFKSRGLLMIPGALVIGCSFTLLAVSASYHPSLLFLFISGILGGISNGLISATMQEESPDYVRGRVMRMYTFILIGMPAVGGLLISLVAAATSLTQSVIYAGISAFVFSVILTAFSKRLRRYEHQLITPAEVNLAE